MSSIKAYHIGLIFFIFLILQTINSFAQDQLILKSVEEFNVKILEIGTDEISYKLADNMEGPVFKVSKNDVFLIVFENGSTWKPKIQEEKVESTESGFRRQRNYNKSLYLIRDTTHHHIISLILGTPEINAGVHTLLFLHGGLAYEWQPKGNIFGLRVMPYYSIAVASHNIVGRNHGKVGVSLSPRFNVKNWKSSQFYVGLEGRYDSYIVDDSSPNVRPWSGYSTGANFIFGGHVTQKSNFNLNIEVGLGYNLVAYTHEEFVGRPILYEEVTDRINQFVGFVRFGVGGRVRSK